MKQLLPVVAVNMCVRAVWAICALLAFVKVEAEAQESPPPGCDPVLPVCGLGSETIIFGSGPVYPARAARNRIEGWVELELRVDSAGNVVEVSVLNSEPSAMFEEEAITAAKRWRFVPREQTDDRVLTPRVIFELVASP